MNRELAEVYLSRAIDGELPPRQQADLDAWLAAHPTERELAEQWSRIGVLTRSVAAAEPVPDVELAWQDIRRAIRTAAPEPVPVRLFPWRLAWAGGIVGALCVTALVVSQWQSAPDGAVAQTGTAQVDWVDSGLPGSSPMIMQDEDSGLAVVWLLPAGQDDRT